MLISSFRHAAHVWVFFPLLTRFFSNSSQDSCLAISYYGATKPISKEVTGFFFLLYRARLLVLPSRSFPKVRHLHIIKLLMEGKKNCCFCANAEGTDS